MYKHTNEERTPKLTLVGAGPGAPGLITVNGAEALKKAPVILFDALVDTDILKYASSSAIKRFVGKRAGLHSYSQGEINDMIVNYALTYGQVVRLKGGDPFVFGRGYEEIRYAESFGIKTDVIPGVTSATGLTSEKKLPLTMRGLNESFWVLTGTTSDREISTDISLAAQTNATAVILMGLRKLGEIMKVYKKAGKKNTAVAIISNGSLPNEKTVTGYVKNIEDVVTVEKIEGPAIIVIGDVVPLIMHKEEKYQLTTYIKEHYSNKQPLV